MYYVTMTDKFMSGWGEATGKINKYIVACDTFQQAITIEKSAQKRDEMIYVNIRSSKPYYNKSRYLESHKHYDDLGTVWTG